MPGQNNGSSNSVFVKSHQTITTTTNDGKLELRVKATPEQIELWRVQLLEALVPVVKQRVACQTQASML